MSHPWTLSQEEVIKRLPSSFLFIGKEKGKYLVQCTKCNNNVTRNATDLYMNCGYCVGKGRGGFSKEQLQKKCHPRIEYIEYVGKSEHKVKCLDCLMIMQRKTNNFKNQCPSCRLSWSTNGCTDEEIIQRCHKNIEYIARVNFGREYKITVKCNLCGAKKHRRADALSQSCFCSSSGYESKAEVELRDWINLLGFETRKLKLQYKGQSTREFDIFIPSLNLVIEYNGLYWHSERVLKGKINSELPRSYHQNKMFLANKNGLRLITIFEDEWLQRKKQVKGFLQSILVIDKKIGARKCTIRQISKQEANIFINSYHIQGQHTHLVAFGLFNQEELIGVITGSKHHRQNGNAKSLVLDRLCFKSGISIAGGSSRLFKRLVEYSIENKYLNIISWSDNRWSEGNIYKKLGFKLEAELKPDYSYVDKSGNRINKQTLKKTKEERLTGKTEYTLRSEQGYDRIWDCGKKRWSYETQ